jgi:NAD+ synthase (glutamine-hydrolysing)
MALRLLHEVLPDTVGMVVSLGLPLVVNNGLFNVAALIADGRILGFVAKQHLAGDGIHYEPRWFKPWPVGIQDRVSIAGPDGSSARNYPVGDLYFDLAGVRLGFEICEDAWAAARPGIRLAQKGVDLLLNPSASHFAFGKLEVRQRFVLEGSRAFGVSYLYANLLGNEAGRAIYDGEAMIATAGRLVAAGPRFSYADFRVTSAVVDLDVTRLHQSRLASFSAGAGARSGLRDFARFSLARSAAQRIPRGFREVGSVSANQGGGIRSGRGAGVVRLPAQKPVDGLCRIAQRGR